MKAYNVLTPNPTTPAATGSGLAKVFLLIVLGAIAVVVLRFWGESRMEARHSAPAVQMTASVTPAPTPTPQAPLASMAKTMSLDTGLGYNLDYEVRETNTGLLITDPDGDMWSCSELPTTVDDWKLCQYAGTVQ